MEHGDKVAIVTGGGRGIGRAIALALAEDRANVVIADLDQKAGQKVSREIATLGRKSLAIQTDVADKASVDLMVRQTLDSFGQVDTLVNNAGLQYVCPLVDFPKSEWLKLIGVMLTGTFFCTQSVLHSMIPKRYGRIINISSVYGRIGAKYKPAYCAAKHGIIGLTRSAALEVAEYDITVNAVCPGPTRTQIVEEQVDSLALAHHMGRDEVLEKVFLAEIPQKRILEPEEIAACVLFLVSDRAKAVTGQAINVSGGWVMS